MWDFRGAPRRTSRGAGVHGGCERPGGGRPDPFDLVGVDGIVLRSGPDIQNFPFGTVPAEAHARCAVPVPRCLGRRRTGDCRPHHRRHANPHRPAALTNAGNPSQRCPSAHAATSRRVRRRRHPIALTLGSSQCRRRRHARTAATAARFNRSSKLEKVTALGAARRTTSRKLARWMLSKPRSACCSARRPAERHNSSSATMVTNVDQSRSSCCLAALSAEAESTPLRRRRASAALVSAYATTDVVVIACSNSRRTSSLPPRRCRL